MDTKYRRKILIDEIKDELEKLIHKIAKSIR